MCLVKGSMMGASLRAEHGVRASPELPLQGLTRSQFVGRQFKLIQNRFDERRMKGVRCLQAL